MLAPMATLRAAAVPPVFNDPEPQRYELNARASEIDPRARPQPVPHDPACPLDLRPSAKKSTATDK